ncbi:MAG TPA: dolichyl-phosphate beta-glucosyltransferase [Vicinamibacteria bacterium]|nr:dolichyl-phosphate beta-glucosyltransferase [Vicinamibacteria bacterium]
MSAAPELSVVIPAYNEAERLPRTLERVRAFLDARGGAYEILVVDDGSADDTVARARAAGGEHLTVLGNGVNRGKGYSVRRGMLAARGARRLMTDADLSTPIEELEALWARMDEGFDVVIASRALALSRIEIHQGAFRENMGRVFNGLVRLLVLPGLRDTQCGFKLFTAAAAGAAFAQARLDGFAFDVEALFIARRLGFRVAELPVVWRNDAASRVGWWKGMLAFTDLARIRANALRGRYARPQL